MAKRPTKRATQSALPALAEDEFVVPIFRTYHRYYVAGREKTCWIVTPPCYGWWVAQFKETRYLAKLEPQRPAEPWEIDAQHRRTFARFILVGPTDVPCCWLAYPRDDWWVNATGKEDNRMLTRVYNVTNGSAFDQCLVRSVNGYVPGVIQIFEEIDRQADPEVSEYLTEALAAGLEDPGYSLHTPAEQKAYFTLRERQRRESIAQSQLAQLTERIRQALSLTGARLGRVEIIANLETANADPLYRVTWERGKQRYVVQIDSALTIVDSGICLSDRDRDFDMASIVDVVRRRPARVY